jgi:hypothetical protein
MTNTFWQPKNKLSIWAIKNDDGDLGKQQAFDDPSRKLSKDIIEERKEAKEMAKKNISKILDGRR